jgi:hypothetical protein
MALYSNTAGRFNTATGVSALYANTEGAFNTALGNAALYANQTGTSNTAAGVNALRANTEGNQNTAFGVEALMSATTAVRTPQQALMPCAPPPPDFQHCQWQQCAFRQHHGTNNAAFGYNAGRNNNPSSALLSVLTAMPPAILSNATAIGFGSIVTASNQVRIGMMGYLYWRLRQLDQFSMAL